MLSIVTQYGVDRGLSPQDALQVFLQAIVLKHLQATSTALIGDTALTLGYGNPRFSEDINLCGVARVGMLKSALERTVVELRDWLGGAVTVQAPVKGKRTWRVRYVPERAGRADRHAILHVDSEPYAALQPAPIVVHYPGLPVLVVASVALEEIMANKLLAVASRRYLSGRDLFDLWFHWWRLPFAESERVATIVHPLLHAKLTARRIPWTRFLTMLHQRTISAVGARTRYEWERYLPATFQQASVYEAIQSAFQQYLGRATV